LVIENDKHSSLKKQRSKFTYIIAIRKRCSDRHKLLIWPLVKNSDRKIFIFFLLTKS